MREGERGANGVSESVREGKRDVRERVREGEGVGVSRESE